jgi:hypothetical protein
MKVYNGTRYNLSNVVAFSEVTSSDGKSVTYTAKKTTDADGNEAFVTETVTNVVEKKAQEIIDFQAKQGWPAAEIDKVQTFMYREAESLSEIKPMLLEAGLDGDKAESTGVDLFNVGWMAAQNKEVRDFMAKSEAVEGAYDLLRDAATPAERRKADPMSKLNKALKDLGINMGGMDLLDMMKQFQSAGFSSAGLSAAPSVTE